jgi:integrase
LLYTAGLRRGELTRLTVRDYDPVEHTLLIRESKFHKSRLLPLCLDAWTALEALLKKRAAYFPISLDTVLLCHNSSQQNGAYSKTGSWKIFRSLFCAAKIHTVSGKLPRIHDLRHTFAVHALLRWYREGADVQSKLPMLSTYMGHVSIESTQYYLRFMEEVMNSAGERFENQYGALVLMKTERGTS